MMYEAVECPFCGGEMVMIECDRPTDGWWARYVCRDCQASAKGAYGCETRLDARLKAYGYAVKRASARLMTREEFTSGEGMPLTVTFEGRNLMRHVVIRGFHDEGTEYRLENGERMGSDSFDETDWESYGKKWRLWRGVPDNGTMNDTKWA